MKTVGTELDLVSVQSMQQQNRHLNTLSLNVLIIIIIISSCYDYTGLAADNEMCVWNNFGMILRDEGRSTRRKIISSVSLLIVGRLAQSV